MGKQGENGISWCDFTFNPWRGCSKVSAGCANCYADTMSKRNPGMLGIWGPNGSRVVASEAMWRAPLKWNKQAPLMVECRNPDCLSRHILAEGMEETFCPKCGDPEAHTVRPRVFCASLADVFEDWDGPMVNVKGETLANFGGGFRPALKGDDFCLTTMQDVRNRLFALIDDTPYLDWLLLTKRPENIRRMWPSNVNTDGKPPSQLFRKNVWLGISAENQPEANKRIPEQLKCRDLSPVLFLSCEPSLGPVDLTLDGLSCAPCPRCYEYGSVRCDVCDSTGTIDELMIDWVIAGGESGPNARPMHPDWARSLRDQCQAAGVPFHFKQWGEFITGDSMSDNEVFRRMQIYKSGNCKPDYVRFYDGERLIEAGSGCTSDQMKMMFRVGKSKAGRLLDGREWNEFPKVEASNAGL